MNRNLLTAGVVMLVVSLAIPALMGDIMGWLMFMFVTPIFVVVAIVLIIVGLVGGEGRGRGGQQQQQMVVVHTGPTRVQLRCPGCGQISATDARFCAACGGRLA